MRVIASMFYFLFSWLRTPVQLVLSLGSGLLMISLVIDLLMFIVATPRQHDTVVKLAVISFLGSFGLFLMKRGYDWMLLKLNRYRLGADRQYYATGVR
jgi:hypothetical protein